MKKTFTILLYLMLPFGILNELKAQCTPTNCLSTLPAYGGICDTVLMTGSVGQVYSDFESFHITTACFDAGVIDPNQAGNDITIDLIDNFTFTGLPAGLSATTNQTVYNSPANGCIAVSGTPSEAGVFAATANFDADITGYFACAFAVLNQPDNPASYALELIILPDPTISIPSTNFSPCDAAVTLTASGTTGGTFSGPGVSGATFDPVIAGPGTHNITYVVSAQQGTAIAPATDSSSITVTVSNSFTVTNSSTDATCSAADGTASINVSGGSVPYFYLWNDGQSTATASGLTAGNYQVTITDSTGCTSSESVTVSSNAVSITGTTTSTNAGCGLSNGSATVTPTNGSSPYSYAWNPGGSTTVTASGLAAGNYSVVVTDANGCTGTISATVNNPSSPIASISGATNVLCNGNADGTATVNATGGTTPYNYLWNAAGQTTVTASGLMAGVYNVTVTDASSCVGTSTVTITEPSVLSTSSTQTDVVCNGGTNGAIDLTVSGGTTGYSYQWSNNTTTEDISNLAAGNYVVTIVDANSCTTSDSVSINEPTAIAVSSTISNVLCNGESNGSIVSSVSGGTAAYTYLWNNAATTADLNNLAAGTYSLTVTDANACVYVEANIAVTEPTVISAAFTTTAASSAGAADGGIDLTASGGTSPYSFVWSNGVLIEDLILLPTGTYSVTITDANGCTFIDSAFVADGPTAIGFTQLGASSKIYPNPVTNQLYWELQTTSTVNVRVQMMNAMGQKLQSQELTAHEAIQMHFELNALPSGVYFMQVWIDEESIIHRFVKE